MADWLPSAEVAARAANLGISAPMLARLGREGLVARPVARGRGRGLGAEQRYPPRVLEQLGAVARVRWRRSCMSRLRHRVWWSGGPLEDWSRWRRDRVAELRVMAQAFAWYAAAGEAARDAAVVDFARYLVAGRRRWTPRTVRGAVDRGSVYAWALDLATSGDLPVNLDQPVDGDGPSVGVLLERGFGLDRRREDVPGAPGHLVAGVLGLLGDPRRLSWRMAQLAESDAVRLRDGLRAWAELGLMPALDDRPDLAGPLLLLVEAMAAGAGYSPTRDVDFRRGPVCYTIGDEAR